MNIYKQFICVRVPLLFVLSESPLDLSVGAQRPVCVGSKRLGIMGDMVEGQGQEHGVCCVCVFVFIGGLMKRSLVREDAVHGSSGVWWKVFTRNLD